MPELPEVTTTVKGLQKLKGLSFQDFWTDITFDLKKWNQDALRKKLFSQSIKDPLFIKEFKKRIIGSKVVKVERKAKNILIYTDFGEIILIHLKMTGHLLYGQYFFKKGKWQPKENNDLLDPYNRFIHAVFSLSNGKKLAFCDSRKFGKITIFKTSEIEKTKHLKKLGPEPLDKKTTKKLFEERLNKKPKGDIKSVLMNQEIISGIGNIYSDEILWASGIHPRSIISKIPQVKKFEIFKNTKKILEKSISLGGDSMSDYRNIDGKKGNFQKYHTAYKKTGTKCSKRDCCGIIKKEIIKGRSSHFCEKHQVLFK